MKKAFTITELLVAVGLLAAVLAASSMIFHYAIDAQRTAAATAEIMRTLRAITDQLNIDFAGLQKNAPMVIRSEGDPNGLRVDSIVFFAVGDFQTTNQYGTTPATIRGNVARIYYGEANEPDYLSTSEKGRRIKILARKQIILAPAESNPTNEYEPNSLIQQVESFAHDPCFYRDLWFQRPSVDPNNVNDIPMYFAKGVDDFSIVVSMDEVNSITHSIDWWPKTVAEMGQSGPNSPDLVKFTFTLYDSKGIIKSGKKFEHIVYIGK